jgi:prolyl-tRNA synthetase
MKQNNIDVWPDYDERGLWTLHIKKKRGKLTLDEITEALKANGDGFVKAMWCGEEECEDKVKEVTGVGSRCIPFNQETVADTCICCGKPAKQLVYWGKAY